MTTYIELAAVGSNYQVRIGLWTKCFSRKPHAACLVGPTNYQWFVVNRPVTPEILDEASNLYDFIFTELQAKKWQINWAAIGVVVGIIGVIFSAIQVGRSCSSE